ncbi:PQQ-binding-like beta-propeller repeat protein [Streptomyces sp. 891-h]|uniref:outer membrane protein assembly factor BamB family protein n=1 Tax=Streptomyces sp. 891-h TaxID=2720714 RepID=UPI001FA98998|nr:PQQ-binding-like beta-propeller repeat protein [Streptomyces sp. 891-h]UNZ18776.1 PQQ-binding-like beta-propeller repeat protein [Streptomyces sp. 891-h]
MVEQLTQHDPRRIGPFEVLGRLGSGGMGLVYLARSASGRRVAIKTVRTELAEDQLFRVRFTREVEAARAVSGFYTAAVVDADPRAAVPWLATAYVPAPSLEEIVTECGPVPVQAVRWLAAGVAEALQSIHGAGLVHRDLKPSNVLVLEDGPRVIDFGIASGVSNTRLTMTNVAVGTPAYMSPEQARDSRSVTGASDIFSLASTLVFAATGHAPFHGANPVETVFMLLREGPDLEGLPDELRPLIESCMRMNAEERPTPADLQAQLAPHLFGAGSDDSGTVSAWLPSTAVSLIERRRGGRAMRRQNAAAAAAGAGAAGSGSGSGGQGSGNGDAGGSGDAVGAGANAGPGAGAAAAVGGGGGGGADGGGAGSALGSVGPGGPPAAGRSVAGREAAAAGPGAASGNAAAAPGAAEWDQGIPAGPRAVGGASGASGASGAPGSPGGAPGTPGGSGGSEPGQGSGSGPVVSRPASQPANADGASVQLAGGQVPIGPGPRRPDETGRDSEAASTSGWVRPPGGGQEGTPQSSAAQPYAQLPHQSAPSATPGASAASAAQAAPAGAPAPAPSAPHPLARPYGAPGPRHAGGSDQGLAPPPPAVPPFQQPSAGVPAQPSSPAPHAVQSPPSAGPGRPGGTGPQPGGPQRWRPWRFRMSNDVWGSPVVADDLVYVTSFEVHALDVASGRRQFKTREVAWSMTVSGGRVHASDGPSLYALDATDGSERWRLATDGWVYSLQVERGTVVTGTRGGGVQAWEAASGEKLWELTGAQADFETPEAGPVIAEGVVYTWADGRLYALEARTGAERWTYPVGDASATGGVPVRVTTAEDGAVYVCAGSRVFALDAATGRERWRFDAPAAFLCPPAFVPGPGVTGGGVYLADYLGTVYALDSGSGHDRWRIATEARHSTEPVVTADGLVHLGSGSALYTLDAVSGTPRWRFATGADVVGAPVVADGRVHFGSADHCLYTVDAVGGQLRWKLATGGEITGSPVAVGGVVYACSKDRCVYALDATKGTGQARHSG